MTPMVKDRTPAHLRACRHRQSLKQNERPETEPTRVRCNLTPRQSHKSKSGSNSSSSITTIIRPRKSQTTKTTIIIILLLLLFHFHSNRSRSLSLASGTCSALHRCFKSTRTTWASPATNSCKLATYSTCQENGAQLQARSSCGRDPTGTHALGV